MEIVVYLISMIIVAFLSVGIGRGLEQKRFCETMTNVLQILRERSERTA